MGHPKQSDKVLSIQQFPVLFCFISPLFETLPIYILLSSWAPTKVYR